MRTLTANAQALPVGYHRNHRGDLAQFVVFASSVSSAIDAETRSGDQQDLPDVAVGLALAAHIATTSAGTHGVSFVVVPRYLEADPDLEAQLRRQHSAVLDGVVLGGPVRISEDTRLLLRQILRQPERSAVLGAIRSLLGDGGTVIAAFLALIGSVAVAAKELPVITPDVIKERLNTMRGRFMPGPQKSSGGEPPGPTPATSVSGPESSAPLSAGPAEFVNALVFVYLHGGRVVRGTYEGIRALGGSECIVLSQAEIVPSDREVDTGRARPVRDESGEFMLVPVQQVELAIKVHQQPPSTDPSGE